MLAETWKTDSSKYQPSVKTSRLVQQVGATDNNPSMVCMVSLHSNIIWLQQMVGCCNNQQAGMQVRDTNLVKLPLAKYNYPSVTLGKTVEKVSKCTKVWRKDGLRAHNCGHLSMRRGISVHR
jgi:hypothetical protein